MTFWGASTKVHSRSSSEAPGRAAGEKPPAVGAVWAAPKDTKDVKGGERLYRFPAGDGRSAPARRVVGGRHGRRWAKGGSGWSWGW